MACRFKYGDKVVVKGKNATVISVIKDHINYICRVKFDNRFLIPREMEFEECQIEFADETKEKCPVCNEKWQVSRFNNKEWRDCIKCNEKAEVIIENYKKEPATYKDIRDKDKDNDDEDFGFYYPI